MNKSYHIPTPEIEFNPPVYICRRTSKQFTLDGNINKDFWQDVPYTDDFLDIEGTSKPLPRYRTRAKLQWDDENLYIAALLEGDEIWATLKERDCVIFYDNDFEIFIDPDSDTQQYIEFEMNALNTVWDLLLTKAYRDNGKPVDGFDLHGLRTAVHINGNLNTPDSCNKSWSAEIVIPFKAISEVSKNKRAPKNGEYYRINFSRVQWKVDIINNQYIKRINPDTGKSYPEDNWVWSPTGVINIHYPELWGFVFFADNTNVDESFVVPEDEFMLWNLRKLYYMEHQFYDDNGFYAKTLTELTGHEISGILLETTSDFFEISCLSSDGIGRLIIMSDGKQYIK